MLEQLVRAPFSHLEVEESWDKSLLEKASKLIGYLPKALTQAEETRVRSVNENIFARALEALGIEPFTIRSVEAYKAKMIQDVCKNQSCAFTQYMHRSGEHTMRKGQTVVHSVGWPSFIALILTVVIGLSLHFAGYETGRWGWDGHKSIQIIGHMPWSSVFNLIALPLLGVLAWAFLMFFRHKKAHAVVADWHIFQVAQMPDSYGRYQQRYDEAIPAFAVQRMIGLKEQLPEVTFSVEQLDANRQDLNTEKRVKLPPDPFLIATFRVISAYIDVWDEPKFEGRRTV